MQVPANLKYTEDHEWIKVDGDVATIGITDYAQGELGDVVFVELPEVGGELTKGDPFGTIEAVKAVSDLFAPANGEVVEINETLADAPETVNKSPYEDGWMLKVKLANAGDLDDLLDAAAYKTKIG
jgi:glycine cleavage system H protein